MILQVGHIYADVYISGDPSLTIQASLYKFKVQGFRVWVWSGVQDSWLRLWDRGYGIG